MKLTMVCLAIYLDTKVEIFSRGNSIDDRKMSLFYVIFENSTFSLKAGLEIGHFEKNSRRKKLKTQEKNTMTQGKKAQGLGKFLPSSGTKPCVLLLKTHSSW